MASIRAATFVRLMAGLGMVAWAVDGGTQPEPGVLIQEVAQVTPPVRTPAPTPMMWPLTSLSTERRPPPPKAVPPAAIEGTGTAQSSTRPPRPAQSAGSPLPPAVVAPPRVGISKPAVVETPTGDRERRVPGARQEPAIAFDASIETILHSPERRLAIVDGRIVQIGDEIRGARIVDITPTVVFLRDANGRLRTLSLGAVR